ncbi:MAG: glycosyltransferase family A protein [Acidimicrobiales bacterium]
MSTVPNSKGAPTAPWSPVVSVVVPTHLPDPPYLREALASVIAQDWANWEAIVVDDGSTATNETLEELVGADPRIRLLRGPRGGPARARNRGLRQARGELVAFLDSDDYWYPSHLASAVSTLAGNQEAVGPIRPWRWSSAPKGSPSSSTASGGRATVTPRWPGATAPSPTAWWPGARP